MFWKVVAMILVASRMATTIWHCGNREVRRYECEPKTKFLIGIFMGDDAASESPKSTHKHSEVNDGSAIIVVKVQEGVVALKQHTIDYGELKLALRDRGSSSGDTKTEPPTVVRFSFEMRGMEPKDVKLSTTPGFSYFVYQQQTVCGYWSHVDETVYESDALWATSGLSVDVLPLHVPCVDYIWPTTSFDQSTPPTTADDGGKEQDPPIRNPGTEPLRTTVGYAEGCLDDRTFYDERLDTASMRLNKTQDNGDRFLGWLNERLKELEPSPYTGLRWGSKGYTVTAYGQMTGQKELVVETPPGMDTIIYQAVTSCGNLSVRAWAFPVHIPRQHSEKNISQTHVECKSPELPLCLKPISSFFAPPGPPDVMLLQCQFKESYRQLNQTDKLQLQTGLVGPFAAKVSSGLKPNLFQARLVEAGLGGATRLSEGNIDLNVYPNKNTKKVATVNAAKNTALTLQLVLTCAPYTLYTAQLVAAETDFQGKCLAVNETKRGVGPADQATRSIRAANPGRWGGSRPSFSRPSFSRPSFSRPPSRPSFSRPPPPRPSFSRPSPPRPSFSRPSPPRPSFSRPSPPRPSFSRPSPPRPSFSRPPPPRPSFTPPRPSFSRPPGGRPSFSSPSRPSFSKPNRPPKPRPYPKPTPPPGRPTHTPTNNYPGRPGGAGAGHPTSNYHRPVGGAGGGGYVYPVARPGTRVIVLPPPVVVMRPSPFVVVHGPIIPIYTTPFIFLPRPHYYAPLPCHWSLLGCPCYSCGHYYAGPIYHHHDHNPSLPPTPPAAAPSPPPSAHPAPQLPPIDNSAPTPPASGRGSPGNEDPSVIKPVGPQPEAQGTRTPQLPPPLECKHVQDFIVAPNVTEKSTVTTEAA